MGDLKRLTDIRQHIADIVERKNLMIVGGYGKSKTETQSVMNRLYTYGNPLKPFIRNTTKYLSDAVSAEKRILFEARRRL